MARKPPGPVYPLALEGVVDAAVTVKHLPASVPGACPTPFLEYEFIDHRGARLIAASTLRLAARTLQMASMNQKLTTASFDLGRGSRKGGPVPQRFTADPTHHPTVLDGFREVALSRAVRDKRGRVSPGRLISQVNVGHWPDGEFPLTWVQIGVPRHATKVSANMLMDVWTEAAFRDRIFTALRTELPSPGPSAREVQVVDGIVGTFPM